MRWLRRLAARLLAAAAILTLALVGWHWARGASLADALRMMADDYRLLAACPAEFGRIRAFAARDAPDGAPASMSARHGGGWAGRVCDGSLTPNDAGLSVTAVRVAPTPTPDAMPSPSPTPSAMPSPSPTPDATPHPSLTPTPDATPHPSHTPSATPPATPPTATATVATPDGALSCGLAHAPPTALDGLPEGARPAERHLETKRLMLDLINDARAAAGLRPLALGSNGAAQLHAEASLAGCFSSHWGLDGLTPAMRYAIAGGLRANAENVSGLDYCVTEADGYRAIASPGDEVREAMEGLMESPGHRAAILDPRHRTVNVGLAWDRYNFIAVQQFEGVRVTYERPPAIDASGVLAFSGATPDGDAFGEPLDLSVQLYHDPPPRPLTRGQLARTYCYGAGLPVAALRPPPGPRSFYPDDVYTASYRPCPSPYDVPADAPAPGSVDEAHASWQAAYDASQTRAERSVTAPWITADEWTADGRSFAVAADLSGVLAEHGAGVYSLTVWGLVEGERAVISEYAIFCE